MYQNGEGSLESKQSRYRHFCQTYFKYWRMQTGPALADAGPNARPKRGAPAQICSTALARELSTFANVREEIC